MLKSILYVWLPTKKIYPLAPVTIANYVHLKRPNILQNILDLSLIPKSERTVVLSSTIKGFDPNIICFTWRDIQIFAPHQDDPSLEFALNCFVYSGIFKWLKASIKGLFALSQYNSKIKENLMFINNTAKDFPQKQVIVGGGAFSVFHDQLMNLLNHKVIGVVGEGEDMVMKLLEDRSFENERYITNDHPMTEWGENTLPVSIFETVINIPYITKIFRQYDAYKNDIIGIQTKRGCPYGCSYCLYPMIEGKRVRIKDPQAIIFTMLSYYKEWGIRKFWFADAQFIPGKNYIPHCEDILEGMLQEKMDIEWSGYIRTGLITPNLAELMVNTGLGDLEVSITSGSQRIINSLDLGFKLEEIYRGCSYLKEAGYNRKLILNYSLNSPGADVESLIESIKSYKKISQIMGEENVIPFIFFLGIQPHTNLEHQLLKSGYLQDGYNPLSLEPKNASKLLYNPPPLNKLLAKAYNSAAKAPSAEKGKAVFKYLEDRLMKNSGS